MSMETIEQKATALADARDLLSTRVQAIEDEIRAIKRRRRAGLKSAAATVAAALAELQAEIDANRTLFAKPRTRVFFGLKVGLQKSKGKVAYANKAKTVALIRRHFKKAFDTLVQTKEAPIDSAVRNLPAADLARIGASISGTGDQVLIKAIDSDIDKLIKAWMDDAEDEQDEEEAA
jgi:hypothetical protein